MLDISVIILTYNEELHIRRCIENINQFASYIYVVDCFSTDKTVQIAKDLGASVIQHEWPRGKYAEQFNWALGTLSIQTEWILRIDADEYFLPDLIDELYNKIPTLPADVSGVIFKRRHILMGQWLKRGFYPVKLLRLFRNGKGKCEDVLMDEHIQLTEGRAVEFEHDFCDYNLNDIVLKMHKYVNYAMREVVDLLNIEYGSSNITKHEGQIGGQASKKRKMKYRYSKMPLFWRSFAYFLYRYFIRGGFLDGKAGFIWAFIQGWWYRTLVDAKISEIKKECGNDKERIKEYLKTYIDMMSCQKF